jgi:hypothetical protein
VKIIHTGIAVDLAAGGQKAQRAFSRNVIKPAMLHGVKTFHHRRYAVRFGSENDRYTSPRQPDYELRKLIKEGHKKRLVWTGDLKKRLTGPNAQVRFTSVVKRGTGQVVASLILTGARKVNRFSRFNRKRTTEELTRLTRADNKVMREASVKMAEQKMQEWNSKRRRLVKRK